MTHSSSSEIPVPIAFKSLSNTFHFPFVLDYKNISNSEVSNCLLPFLRPIYQ